MSLCGKAGKSVALGAEVILPTPSIMASLTGGGAIADKLYDSACSTDAMEELLRDIHARGKPNIEEVLTGLAVIVSCGRLSVSFVSGSTLVHRGLTDIVQG